MNFSVPTQDKCFRAQVREYLAGQTPRAPEILSEEAYYPLARKIRQGIGKRGWLTLAWPGYGSSPAEDLILREEMAYFDAPRANDHGTHLAGLLIFTYGTEAQKARHLEHLAQGEEWWCVGFTEPMAGSDLGGIRARATPLDDGYLLTGQKDYVEWAHQSGWCHLLARTGPGTSGSEGITYFLLDMKSPGIFLNPVAYAAGLAFCEVFLDQVKVFAEDVLGEVNKGWTIAMHFLDMARSGIEFVGWAQRLLDESIASLEKGCHRPAVRHRLAEAAMDIQVARLLSYRSVRPASQGGPPAYQASVAKLFASETWRRVSEIAMEVVGLRGQGGKEEKTGYLVQSFLLKAHAGGIYLGPSEVHRDRIAHQGLELPR